MIREEIQPDVREQGAGRRINGDGGMGIRDSDKEERLLNVIEDTGTPLDTGLCEHFLYPGISLLFLCEGEIE